MVRLTVIFHNGDLFDFASEASGAQAVATDLVTQFYAQRNLVAQQTIDRLTEQLTQQNDRLAAGVASLPRDGDPTHPSHQA